uniref:Uncharacterized protein n=1 Tax=Opuntia streptacantha TaxID=393608 RepID=A0A7C9EAH3_OPUST
MLLRHFHQLNIPTPIILPRLLSLHQSPPHIHHHTFNSRTLQRLQTRVHRLPPIHRVIHLHTIQRHHHIHRHSFPRRLGRTTTSNILPLRQRFLRLRRRKRQTSRRQIRPKRRPQRTHRRRQCVNLPRPLPLSFTLQRRRRRRRLPHRRRTHRRRRCLGGPVPGCIHRKCRP